MTFASGGYLMSFKHQLANQILITNLEITNCFDGSIILEAANKGRLQYKTKVKIQNSRFDSIDMNFDSLIWMYEGADLEIRNSTFNKISSKDEGAIIFAGYQETTTNIYDSTFTNNTAVEATLFYVEAKGVIRLYNCNALVNFAVISTIIKVSNDGYFEVYNSTLHHNYALSNVISEMISSSNESIIDKSSIYENQILSLEEFEEELLITCQKLCFMASTLRTYLIQNPLKYKILSTPKLLGVIQAKLIIRNNSKIYMETSVMTGFMSTIIFENSQIYSIVENRSSVKLATTHFTMTNCHVYNITSLKNTEFIDAAFDSVIQFNNVTYTTSTSALMILINSAVNITQLSLTNAGSYYSSVKLIDCTNVVIQDSQFKYLTISDTSDIVSMYSSNITLIKNTTLSALQQVPVYFKSCVISIIDGLILQNSTYGLLLSRSSIGIMRNSLFDSLGVSNSIKGGGMQLIDSNATITTSTFINNKAMNGAGLYFS